MSRPVYAVEVTAHDGTSAATYYFGSEGFCTGPSDTPANTHFDPRVVDPGNYASDMFGWVTGAQRRSAGQVVLNNADGGLDAVAAYGFDGRPIVIRRGVPGTAYPAAWQTLLTGTMEQAEFTWDEVSLLTRDRLAEVFAKPYQPTKYAGTNALPSGEEGVATDLKGKPKPRLLGKVRGISPPMTNTDKLVCQLSDGQINSVDAVYVGGSAVTAGTARASLALLESNTPGAGTYDYYLGAAGNGAFIRLASTPNLPLTVDATQGAAASDRTAAQLAKQILLAAGVASGDIDSGSVAALDTANSGVVGVWTGTEEETVGDVLQSVLRSVGADVAVDSTGKFFFARLESPSGTELTTLEAFEVLDSGGNPVERAAPATDSRGLPCYSVIVNYRKNYTVLTDTDLAGAVTAAVRNQLRQEWLATTSTDGSVQTQFLLAPQLTFESLLDSASDAATEAARLLALYKVRRDVLTVLVPQAALDGVTLRHGGIVTLQVGRFDWAGGKQFVLCGVGYQLAADEVTLRLWG